MAASPVRACACARDHAHVLVYVRNMSKSHPSTTADIFISRSWRTYTSKPALARVQPRNTSLADWIMRWPTTTRSPWFEYAAGDRVFRGLQPDLGVHLVFQHRKLGDRRLSENDRAAGRSLACRHDRCGHARLWRRRR